MKITAMASAPTIALLISSWSSIWPPIARRSPGGSEAEYDLTSAFTSSPTSPAGRPSTLAKSAILRCRSWRRMFSGLKTRSMVAMERSATTSGEPSASERPVEILRFATSSTAVRLARGSCVITS